MKTQLLPATDESLALAARLLTAGELIAFPTRSLMDILGHFQSGSLHFTFTGAEGPCGITGPDDAEYTVILMPMKIAESSYYTEED